MPVTPEDEATPRARCPYRSSDPRLALFRALALWGTRAGPESSSDLVQSALREAWLGLDREQLPDDPGHLKALVFRIAEHKIVDRAAIGSGTSVMRDATKSCRTRVWTCSAATHASAAPAGQLVSFEEIQRIEGAFDTLPVRYRDAILMVRWLDYSYEQLGAEMDLSPHAARTLFSRACARLAALLADQES